MFSIGLFAAAIFSFLSIGQTANTLKDVGSFIQEDPDSALAVLESIDSSKLCTRSLRAQYSLWHTMALDKTTFYVTDENLIRPAVDYYKYHGSKEMRMMSLFYLGRIQFNNEDWPGAIISQLKVKAIAEDIGSVYWKGMCYSDLAGIFGNNFYSEHELRYDILACDAWKEYGRGQDINQAIWSLAVAYHNNYQRELSDSLFLLLADVPEYAPQAFVGLAGNESCFPPSNYETIVELYSKALSLGAELELAEWCRYAYALTRIGLRTEAESVMSQLSGYEDAAIYEYYWKTYRDDGLYEKALYECTRTYQLSDSTVNSQLNQSLFKAETEYFGQEAEISEMKAKHIKTVWGLTIFLSFVALGLFVSELRRRNIRNQLRLEEADMIVNESFRLNKMLQQGNEELQCEIDSVRSKTYSLQRMLLGQYRSGFAEIAALVETPNTDKIDNVAAKRYLSKVKELISEIESDGAGWSKFEARLNESFDGVIRKLRIDYPSLSEKRIKLFSFITIGFDATTCAVLLNEKQEYVRVMKSRLHQFLESNPTENTALYRMCLNEYK